MKQKIGFIGGLICAFTIVAFAVHLTIYDVPQNVASWTMWAVLDALMVCSAIAAGNKRPWLPAGFFLGALFVTIILLTKGVWQWRTIETISAIGTAIASLCWWKMGAKVGVVASTLAMTIAGIPAMHDAWVQPDPSGWWLWGGVAFSCSLSIYSGAWKIEHQFLPCTSIVFNTVMLVLVLR